MLPEMYRHCKATEDKDMTPIDFITDHLINIDCMFDNHKNGDEQKPHQPLQNHNQGQQNISFVTYFVFSAIYYEPLVEKTPIGTFHFQPSGYVNKIFHPPKFV